MAKYNKGDKVEIVSNGSLGVIKEVTSYGSDGNDLYIVIVDDKEKIYSEANLKIVKKYNTSQSLNLDDVSAAFQIEDRVNDIIANLALSKPESMESQLVNACKVHMYLATAINYDDEVRTLIGSNLSKINEFKDFTNGKLDSVVNAYLFSEVLNKTGSKVLNIALRDENGEYYISNLVLIGEDYYYFDVTLEHSVFIENGAELKNFVLCCGALGKGSYEQFFKPISLVDFHNNLIDEKLPDNIARLDIDIDLVNKLINI